MKSYGEFIAAKRTDREVVGFGPLWLPDFLYDFQRLLTDWAIRRGRAALFEDCGLGKTPQSLVWSDNVVRKSNQPVLILAPLAVSRQFVREGDKFGIEVHEARDGRLKKGINVVNYQRLHYFDPSKLAGLVCDESGCLKHFDSKTRIGVTQFCSGIRYRLLGTATPAPNDFMELGTSSEALGEMGRNQMLGVFFSHSGESAQQWELKGHARTAYWRWVARWARAIRKPSDFGFDNGQFDLPPLEFEHHLVTNRNNGVCRGLVGLARTRDEQLKERRDSLESRCEKVAEMVPQDRPCVVWCQLNDEADLLERLISGAVQVAGSQPDEVKEDRLTAFSTGQIRVLVTKPRIAGWGLNWQHCADVFCFPDHSYEAFYQTIRRCWRFGQENPVKVNLVYTNAQRPVLQNMLRKERQVDAMFAGIIREMHEYQTEVVRLDGYNRETRVPAWL